MKWLRLTLTSWYWLIPQLQNYLTGLFPLVAAGGLAAALSTAAGLLLAIASSISHDLLKGVFMPEISEKNELLASRGAMVFAVLGAGYLGLHPPDFAAGTVAIAFGFSAASTVPCANDGYFL